MSENELPVETGESHDGDSLKLMTDGGADRDRTDDLRLAKPALSQLSYSPEKRFQRRRRD